MRTLNEELADRRSALEKSKADSTSQHEYFTKEINSLTQKIKLQDAENRNLHQQVQEAREAGGLLEGDPPVTVTVTPSKAPRQVCGPARSMLCSCSWWSALVFN